MHCVLLFFQSTQLVIDSWSEIAMDIEARWLHMDVPSEYSGGVSGLIETTFPCWNVGHFFSSIFIHLSMNETFSAAQLSNPVLSHSQIF